MKQVLRKLCSPILNIFEKGPEPEIYKSLNRKILIIIGIMFSGLATAVLLSSSKSDDYGYLIPCVVFYCLALVCLIIGLLGDKRAVMNIWGNK